MIINQIGPNVKFTYYIMLKLINDSCRSNTDYHNAKQTFCEADIFVFYNVNFNSTILPFLLLLKVVYTVTYFIDCRFAGEGKLHFYVCSLNKPCFRNAYLFVFCTSNNMSKCPLFISLVSTLLQFFVGYSMSNQPIFTK